MDPTNFCVFLDTSINFSVLLPLQTRLFYPAFVCLFINLVCLLYIKTTDWMFLNYMYFTRDVCILGQGGTVKFWKLSESRFVEVFPTLQD